MREFIDVATLGKAKGKTGRLAAHAAAGLPFLLEAGAEVSLVPPRDDLPRRVTVAEARCLDGARGEVLFQGVSPEDARGLAGMHCLVRRSSIAAGALEGPSALWLGWRIVDGSLGLVGTVSDVIDNPGQVLLQVDRGESRQAALVPAVDEIIVSADPEEGVVRVALPAGLLDL